MRRRSCTHDGRSPGRAGRAPQHWQRWAGLHRAVGRRAGSAEGARRAAASAGPAVRPTLAFGDRGRRHAGPGLRRSAAEPSGGGGDCRPSPVRWRARRYRARGGVAAGGHVRADHGMGRLQRAGRRGFTPRIAGGGDQWRRGSGTGDPPRSASWCNPARTSNCPKPCAASSSTRRLRADMAEAAWRVGQSLPGWPAQAAIFVEAALA